MVGRLRLIMLVACWLMRSGRATSQLERPGDQVENLILHLVAFHRQCAVIEVARHHRPVFPTTTLPPRQDSAQWTCPSSIPEAGSDAQTTGNQHLHPIASTPARGKPSGSRINECLDHPDHRNVWASTHVHQLDRQAVLADSDHFRSPSSYTAHRTASVPGQPTVIEPHADES